MQKYRNIKENGFDSRLEKKRYNELLYLQRLEFIQKLERQPKITVQDGYHCMLNGVKKTIRVINYIADFKYEEGGKTVYEDVKSIATEKKETYRIKKKLIIKKLGENEVFRENIDGVINDYENFR